MNFNFLFDISSDGVLPWWHVLLNGLALTVGVAIGAGLIAFLLGSLIGVLRTMSTRWVRLMAGAYVEIFRAVPLLVQLFLWYYVMPELVSPLKQLIVNSSPQYVAFVMSVLCLGTYTAARVAEHVRAGIEARSGGVMNAAYALGLSPGQSYRHVILPVVYRLLIPTLTSEAMSLVKNTSVAYSIGLTELFLQILNMGETTFRFFESFFAGAIGYAIVNMLVLAGARWAERRYGLVGMMGGRAA